MCFAEKSKSGRKQEKGEPLKVSSLKEAVSSNSPFVRSLGSNACLSFDGGEISWKEFAEKVHDLALAMQTLPEGNVAIMLRRSCSLVIAQAASHLAGRTFIPLDPTWTQNRIEFIVESTCSSIMIIDEDASPPAIKHAVAFVAVDTQGNCVRGPSVEGKTLDDKPSPEVMYVMYTSGSTGAPKGVEVYTDGVIQFLRWKVNVMKVKQNDVFILKTPCTFDVSISEVWLPLVTGTRSHILGDGFHVDPMAVHQTLIESGVTVCHFVPSMLLLFLAVIPENSLPKLRLIQCTGEALKMEHRRKLTKALGSRVGLLNLYGPTEATVENTYFYCEDNDKQDLSHGFPIGWPGAGNGVHIVDVNDPNKRVKEGEKGEICLSGIQVAKGYLGRDDLTSERFLPCPWDKSGRGMMYRTGDIGGKNLETGWYEYFGRMDRQVKVGGVRIELGEIESVTMRLFPEELEAAIVVFMDGLLTGVVVPNEGIEKVPDHKELSDGICSILPSAYNPAEWFVMSHEQVPLNSAGKIDFNAVEKWLREKRTVNDWGEVYNDMYADNTTSTEADGDPTMDWAGYEDSFNPGNLHERSVITEWVEKTVEEVLDHAKESAGNTEAARVLEMGCGKGMILLKTAPRVKVCVGADVSSRALDHVQKIWDGYLKQNDLQGSCEKLSLVACDATGFDRLPSSVSSYHTIVCNGVSMYFPSFNYVLDYLNLATDRIVETGGSVLLGDVRSFHHSALFQLRRLLKCGKTPYEARQTAAAVARDDKDRTYDHRAFYMLQDSGILRKRVAAVEVQLKEGSEDSEFSGYRYNVAVHCLPRSAQDSGKEISIQNLEVKKVADLFSFEEHKTIDINGHEIVTLLKNAMSSTNGTDNNVYACVNIPNQRLYSDVLVARKVDDKVDFASPVGVKPALLREQLREHFPSKHVVLTWSRDIGVVSDDIFDESHFTDPTLGYMDVFLVPNQSKEMKLAGLQAVSRYCLEPHQRLIQDLTSENGNKKQVLANIEKYISKINTSATATNGNKSVCAITAAEVAREHSRHGDYDRAVHVLITSALGISLDHFDEMLNEQGADNFTFEECGGNSFVAMKLIGNMRSTLGAAPPVFKLLTDSLSSFIRDAVTMLKASKEAAEADWFAHMEIPGKKGSVTSNAPILILFPVAGGSPKSFAQTFSELRKMVTTQSDFGADVLIAQPPGRDARADEPNMTDFEELLEKYIAALVKPLNLGNSRLFGKRHVIMCGDSIGSVTCWSIVHELNNRYGFMPDHVVVSGNACPTESSEQWGLGDVATKSIHDCTDEDLVSFISTGLSSREGENGNNMEYGKEILEALRCDCVMYEAFKRNPSYEKLPIKATLCRGEKDTLVSAESMVGWKNEFESLTEVVVPDAGHHIYVENGPAMAKLFFELSNEN